MMKVYSRTTNMCFTVGWHNVSLKWLNGVSYLSASWYFDVLALRVDSEGSSTNGYFSKIYRYVD